MEHVKVKTEAVVNGSATPLDPRTPRNYPIKSPNPVRDVDLMRTQAYESRPKFSGMMVRPTFTNILPDLPMDPKFVKSSLKLSRFVEYKASSLDMQCQHEVHFDPNIHAHLDLVIPPERNPVYMSAAKLLGREEGEIVDLSELGIDEKDAALLEDDETALKGAKFPLKRSNKFKQPRSASHSKSVAWLRRTEYISTEQTRFQPQFLTAQDRIEAKIGFSLQKERKKLTCDFDDHDTRVKAIEKTFNDIKKPITEHFSKPGVVPVEVMEVFPDFELWKYQFTMVNFDSSPLVPGKGMSDEFASGSMIRGVTDDTGDQFVAYFLPKEETFQKLRQEKAGKVSSADVENPKYEYQLAREYNWQVKAQSKGIENLFFVMRDDNVFYNEIQQRIAFTKRRTPGTPYQKQVKSILTVNNVPKSEKDDFFEQSRERQLQPKPEGDYDEPEVSSDVEDDGFNMMTEDKGDIDIEATATGLTIAETSMMEVDGSVEDRNGQAEAELGEQGKALQDDDVENGVEPGAVTPAENVIDSDSAKDMIEDMDEVHAEAEVASGVGYVL